MGLVCFVIVSFGPHGPDDFCHLVGERNVCDVVVFLLLDVGCPLLQPRHGLTVHALAMRAVNKQHSQILVTSFADAPHYLFVT